MSRSAFFLCAGLGAFLCCVVLLMSQNPDGWDEPCVDLGPNQSRVESHDYLIPPLVGTCRAYSHDGELLGSRSFPSTEYWIYALIAFLSPFAIGLVGRRLGWPPSPGWSDRWFPKLPPR